MPFIDNDILSTTETEIINISSTGNGKIPFVSTSS